MTLPYRGLWLLACLLLAAPTAARAQLDAESYNMLLDDMLAAHGEGRYKDFERLALRIKAHDEQYPDRYGWRLFLGLAYKCQGKFKEARPLLEEHVRLAKRDKGESEITIEGMLTLGGCYLEQSDLEAAEPVLTEVTKIALKKLGADHQTTLGAQTNLAYLFKLRGDLRRAEELNREIIDRYHRLNVRDPVRLSPVINQAVVLLKQGRFDRAEATIRHGLGVAKWLALSDDHPQVISLSHNLGVIYIVQSRPQEARQVLERTLPAAIRTLGADHPKVGGLCADLAAAYGLLGQLDKERALREQAIKFMVASLGEDHPDVAILYANQGVGFLKTKEYPQAEERYRKALAINLKTYGPNHFQTAVNRIQLSDLYWRWGKLDEAEAESKQALAVEQGIDEMRRHDANLNLAGVTYLRGRKREAIDQLQAALSLAESSRAFAGGGEVERAAHFTRFASSYHRLVCWQATAGLAPDVFTSLERAHARTFLESMNQAGIDLLAGRPAAARAQLQQQRQELREQVSRSEAALDRLPMPEANAGNAERQQRQKAEKALSDARDALYQFERDLRSSSSAYREVIRAQAQLPTMATVQQRLVPKGSLLLSYAVGADCTHLLAVGPDKARLFDLEISPQDAKALDCPEGSLTRDILHRTLQDGPNAVLPRLAQREPIDDLRAKLHALWRVLLPAELRAEITSGELERLIILPDGPLALLPFDTLVVNSEGRISHLLDVGPPILYGPSASVLLSLSDRPQAPPAKQAVLTLGDPLYAPLKPGEVAGRQRLKPLPYTGNESRAFAEIFKKSGLEPLSLLQDQATEGQLRAAIAGRRIVHLACHGLSDDAYGNFFGMLALAPGKQAGNPQDDGTLTLAEIYELDLKGCELAILSACRTNHGPEQQGEGVWSLSRGFLVAGARRVVASNWLVDDEAGSNLVTVFCNEISREKPDYAAALHKAKLWVREQERWKSPYNWGTFVMIGPR